MTANDRSTTRLDRRVLLGRRPGCGSERLVRETMILARGKAALKNRRLTRAFTDSGRPTPLCSFKQLRVPLE